MGLYLDMCHYCGTGRLAHHSLKRRRVLAGPVAFPGQYDEVGRLLAGDPQDLRWRLTAPEQQSNPQAAHGADAGRRSMNSLAHAGHSCCG